MAYAAYFSFEWLGSVDYIQTQTRATLAETLADPALRALFAGSGAFRLVWGPACYQAPVSAVADTTVFVCEAPPLGSKNSSSESNEKETVLYVAVAGTHPLSVFNWFLDLDVARVVPWPHAAAPDGAPLGMAQGTLLGLRTLLALRDPFASDSDSTEEGAGTTGTTTTKATAGPTLVEYLSTRAKECAAQGKRLRVVTVGHSLGGALAHATALFLHDTARTWAPRDADVAVGAVTFAAPTFATAALARHYDRCLGARTVRLANRYDLVPAAWDVDELSRVYTLYEPAAPTPLALAVALQGVIDAVRDRAYRHVCAAQHPFAQAPQRPDHDFLRQVVVQHNQSYFLYLRMQALAPFIARHVPLMRELIWFVFVTFFVLLLPVILHRVSLP